MAAVGEARGQDRTTVAQVWSFWSIYWYWPGAQQRDWSHGYLSSNWYRRCLKPWACVNSPTERIKSRSWVERGLCIWRVSRGRPSKGHREGRITVRKCGFTEFRGEGLEVVAIHSHWEGGQALDRKGNMEPGTTWCLSLFLCCWDKTLTDLQNKGSIYNTGPVKRR